MKSTSPALAFAAALTFAAFGAHAQTTAPSANPQSPANTTGQTTQTAPTASGQTMQTSPGTSDRQSQLENEDSRFLENAIQGSHAEVVGSQLALEKTKNADVKAFAEAMIADHSVMIKEATALATKKGMEPPTGPSVMQTTEITALKALTGGAFDAMYVNRIGVASHESTVERFEEASQQAKDPEVKALATKTLPKLQHHLEMARKLDEKQDREDEQRDRQEEQRDRQQNQQQMQQMQQPQQQMQTTPQTQQTAPQTRQ